MNKNPAISIIIPVYNVEKYLAEGLDSVLAQTFTDFEAVCIDDGSPDNCGKILDEYALKDARIKVIHQENGGEAVARNRGIEAAIGEYIYFMDDDDYIHPQTLEILHKIITESGLDGVVFKHNEVHVRYQPMEADINIDEIKYQVIAKPLERFLNSKKVIAIAPWCKLYKRGVIGNNRFVKGIHFDDVPFNIQMLYSAEKIALIDERLYYFFQNQKSVSHTGINVKKVRNYITIIRSIYDFMMAKNDPIVLRELQIKCLPTYVNVVIGGVIKNKKHNPELYCEMLPILKEGIRELLAEKIISYNDFKLRKKWEIFKLLHFR